MNTDTHIRCYGYDTEIDKIYREFGSRILNLWDDTPRYEERDLQSFFILELLNGVFKEPGCSSEFSLYFSNDDDYFERTLCLDRDSNSLYIKEEYESYTCDDIYDDSEIVEHICSTGRLERKSIEDLLRRVEGYLALPNTLKVIEDTKARNTYTIYYLNKLQKICYKFIEETNKNFEKVEVALYSTYELMNFILKEAFNEEGTFKTFVFYNVLLHLDEFVEYITDIKNSIVLARGFLINDTEDHYRFNKQLCNHHREKTPLDFISTVKNLTLSNIHSKVFSKLKKHICLKEVGFVDISERKRFVEEALDPENELKISSLKAPILYYSGRFDSYRPKDDSQILRTYQGNNVSLTKGNIIHYNVTLTPKAYAPSKTYTMELCFTYESSPRLEYLIDFDSEPLTSDDIENSNIHITHLKILDTSICN